MELLLAKPLTREKTNAEHLKSCEGQIIFDNVSLKLGGKIILRNVTFFADSNEICTLGIVGGSSTGKSTIASLTVRIFEPDT